mgnify:CR=1 FL=1
MPRPVRSAPRVQVNIEAQGNLRTRFQAACSEANAPGHVLLARLLDLYDESRGLRRSTVQHPLGYMRPVAAKRKPRRKPKPKAAQ